ncbi:unnamed protein product [Durusdinium trenchii]|uniref:Uncharacterized protein n=1 Tax=Durusdinium trenchii TaxID=1381693 RepID=A0ABP0SVI6_9DINO
MAYSTASAPPAPVLNLLSAAQRVWKDVGPEIKASSELKEGPLLPPEELKKGAGASFAAFFSVQYRGCIRHSHPDTPCKWYCIHRPLKLH